MLPYEEGSERLEAVGVMLNTDPKRTWPEAYTDCHAISYCIVGYFQGRKPLQILQNCGHQQKFFCKLSGMVYLVRCVAHTVYNVKCWHLAVSRGVIVSTYLVLVDCL